MTNLQILKEIKKAVKNKKEVKVVLEICHAEDNEVGNWVHIEDKNGFDLEHNITLESQLSKLEDTEKNTKKLQKEFSSLKKYLDEYFTVEIIENWV